MVGLGRPPLCLLLFRASFVADRNGRQTIKPLSSKQWVRKKPVKMDIDFRQFRVLGRGGFGMVTGVSRLHCHFLQLPILERRNVKLRF